MLALSLEPILATSLVYLFAHARNLLLGQLVRLLGQVLFISYFGHFVIFN